ncbi:hypothetical protein [Cellulomonas sp. KRMCY2]|uniref:hypothetical protein n=1 Tax=Cellulomonas sp. KRMCY2 TaxID=1304865 RepID=UPI00045E68CA|nr:hypothetical protein [Cellulomonas sp. KRMCY2]
MSGSKVAIAAVFVVIGVASILLDLWWTAIAMAIGLGGVVVEEWKRRRSPVSAASTLDRGGR